MRALESTIVDTFINALTQRALRLFPATAASAGTPAEFRRRIAAAVARARDYGFRDRALVAQWVDWECRHGDAFEQRPEWQWMRNILETDLDADIKMFRIERRLARLEAAQRI